jgi:hypothetical protein
MKTSVNMGEAWSPKLREAVWSMKTPAQQRSASEKSALGVEKQFAKPSDERTIAQIPGKAQFEP